MDPIKLSDIRPEPSSFTMKAFPGGPIQLRKFTIMDQDWVRSRYGEEISKVFAEVRVKDLCTIVVRLLANDADRARLAPQNVKFQNEDTGEITEGRMGGAALLASLIDGTDELLGMLQALLRTIGISQPLEEKLSAEQDAEKKSTQAGQSAGVRSSTPSPANTDGALTTLPA